MTTSVKSCETSVYNGLPALNDYMSLVAKKHVRQIALPLYYLLFFSLVL